MTDTTWTPTDEQVRIAAEAMEDAALEFIGRDRRVGPGDIARAALVAVGPHIAAGRASMSRKLTGDEVVEIVADTLGLWNGADMANEQADLVVAALQAEGVHYEGWTA